MVRGCSKRVCYEINDSPIKDKETVNIKMIQSGYRILVRTVRMMIIAFPNRKKMEIRWDQMKICFRVMYKGLRDKP